MPRMPDLQEWNLQSLAVIQAALGTISPNFRMITLDHDGLEWVIGFVLSEESVEDTEEIEDFGTEWDALQGGPTARRIEVSISAEPLQWPPSTTRVLYRRREPLQMR